MPERIGHYVLLEQLERGPVEVFRARDTRQGRTVTLELLAPAIVPPADRDRFHRAVEPAAALSHPGIAMLFDSGEWEGRPFLVFEYAPGQSLRALLSDGPLPVRRALELLARLADAMAYAHAAGVAHGAFGAETVVVMASGRPKILDFGVAAWTRRRAPAGADARAATNDAPGGLRDDLAALGALLEETLGGSAGARRSDPTGELGAIVERARAGGESGYAEAAVLAQIGRASCRERV